MQKRPPRPITPETKLKISATLKKKWEDEDFRNYMSAKRKLHFESLSEEEKSLTKKKISDTLKKKWTDEEFRTKMELNR